MARTSKHARKEWIKERGIGGGVERVHGETARLVSICRAPASCRSSSTPGRILFNDSAPALGSLPDSDRRTKAADQNLHPRGEEILRDGRELPILTTGVHALIPQRGGISLKRPGRARPDSFSNPVRNKGRSSFKGLDGPGCSRTKTGKAERRNAEGKFSTRRPRAAVVSDDAPLHRGIWGSRRRRTYDIAVLALPSQKQAYFREISSCRQCEGVPRGGVAPTSKFRSGPGTGKAGRFVHTAGTGPRGSRFGRRTVELRFSRTTKRKRPAPSRGRTGPASYMTVPRSGIDYGSKAEGRRGLEGRKAERKRLEGREWEGQDGPGGGCGKGNGAALDARVEARRRAASRLGAQTGGAHWLVIFVNWLLQPSIQPIFRIATSLPTGKIMEEIMMIAVLPQQERKKFSQVILDV